LYDALDTVNYQLCTSGLITRKTGISLTLFNTELQNTVSYMIEDRSKIVCMPVIDRVIIRNKKD